MAIVLAEQRTVILRKSISPLTLFSFVLLSITCFDNRNREQILSVVLL